MDTVSIIGVGMTPFGKFPDRSLRDLGTAAIAEALADAGVAEGDVDLVVHANAIGGLMTGQEMTRGQVVVSGTTLAGKPLVNVENACASSSTALHLAAAAVLSGMYRTVLVVGNEKMSGHGTRAVLDALATAADVDRIEEFNRELTGSTDGAESFFMEVYAQETRDYMARSGATPLDFASIAAKNSDHAALNPHAQYRTRRTPEEILASRLIAQPLTMLMCSPVADGAAALVVRATDDTDSPDAVRVRASVVRTGIPGGGGQTLERRTAEIAYEQAGFGPDELDVIELHDAASPNELLLYEELGLCAPGEGPKLARSGATALGGDLPVNTSGGLVSKGHPVGATGAAQIVELVTQLRGRAGDRQVSGAHRALAENAGGYSHPEAAACAITILSRD